MVPDESQQAFDPREYLRPIGSRIWLILAIVLVATTAAYFYSSSKPNRYRAGTNIFLTTSQVDQVLSEGSVAPDDDRATQTLAALIASRSVAEETARRIGYNGDPRDLLNDLDVLPASGADYLTIEVEQGSPIAAARLANAFAQAFIASRSATTREQAETARATAERRLQSLQAAGGNRDAVRSLRSRIQRLRVIETLPAGAAEQVDRALPPSAPVSPKPKRDAAFAFVIALVLAIGLAFGLERFDRRIKRIEEIEPLYGAPLLGVIQHLREPNPKSGLEMELPEPAREAFRMLRSNLQLADLDNPLRTVLITSAVPEEGKSTVVRNLALAYREAGLRVAVAELDLRRPTLARLFQVQREPGFTNVLVGGGGIAEALQPVPVTTGQPTVETPAHRASGTNGPATAVESRGTLAILTSGAIPPNPPAVLAAARVAGVLEELKADHDIVLVDTAPVLAVGDTLPLLSAVDGVVVVTRADSTTKDAAKRLADAVSRAPGARVVGVVVNDMREEQAGHLSYYRYDY